jgi:hypothetical protein
MGSADSRITTPWPEYAPSYRSAATLEELDGAFVLLGRRARFERPEVSSLSGLGILLARVQSIATVFELSNHESEHL